MEIAINHWPFSPSPLQPLTGADTSMQAEQRQVILDLIQQLEGHGSTDGITQELQRVAGDWRLLFSTIAITVCSLWPSHDVQAPW